MELLPIGSRVTHFDGGEFTHGKGTIIGYNGVSDSTKALEVIASGELDSQPDAVQQLVVKGAICGAYSGSRCPYVVHFDPSEKYPDGYKDVYEVDSVFLLVE